MSWTFGKALQDFASLGAEYAPGAVYIERDGRRVVVVEAQVGVGCALTPQGATILSEINAAPPAPKASKKPKKVVESDNTSASEPDDFDLDD